MWMRALWATLCPRLLNNRMDLVVVIVVLVVIVFPFWILSTSWSSHLRRQGERPASCCERKNSSHWIAFLSETCEFLCAFSPVSSSCCAVSQATCCLTQREHTLGCTVSSDERETQRQSRRRPRTWDSLAVDLTVWWMKRFSFDRPRQTKTTMIVRRSEQQVHFRFQKLQQWNRSFLAAVDWSVSWTVAGKLLGHTKNRR